MRKTAIFTLALCFSAASGQAGTYVEPVVEPVIIKSDTQAEASGAKEALVLLFAALLIGAVMSK